ncbi:DJ-1/PfpI family protein [Gemmata sp. G18]|uniref:DJ-1/PfpI family protein n=1 Tax=Gemmata palustris TaxID=2822762 RepID=A0ABS5BL46_9BACT|nr:DJ-1/PfpI family protein [Gemmata palustris]MBP3954421.1 DJ-1/PfpI family protein [Gemmata palustris]
MTRRDAMKVLGTAVVAPAAAAPVRAADAKKPREILMLVYPKFTALDLVGPQHVFSLLGPEFKTRLVWKDTKEVVSDTGIPVRPTATFKECAEEPAVVFVPGGTDGTLAAMEDKAVREFVAARGAKATFVTSVCTGALVLGAAGLLTGYKATTHWLALDALRGFGAVPVAERVVTDRNRVTGAGVTAGIDFALTLAAKLKDEKYAKAIQLMSEYDPQPPFPKDGNPLSADADNVKLLRAMTVPFNTKLDAAIKRLGK